MKKLRSEGQLDDLHDLRSRFSPFAFLLRKQSRDTEKMKNVMIYNQFNNVIEIIDLARFYLIFSSENMVKKYSLEFMKDDDSDTLERISSYFLLSSIIYFNSSFDYIRILVRLIYSTHKELSTQFKKKKISEKIEKWKLEKHDWYVALFKLIQDISSEEEKIWIEENPHITKEIIKSFSNIKKYNKKLKRKYRANLIKHNAFPSFKRSNIENSIDARLQISLDSFYENKGGVSCGIPKMLYIEEVQKFLIKYNNRTVKHIISIAEIFLNSKIEQNE